jgi:hypothetical protein
VAAFASTFATHDLIIGGYLLLTSSLVWRAGGGFDEDRALCARRLYASIGGLILACLIGRAETGIPATVRSWIYRVAGVAVLVESYLVLKQLLPIVQPGAVDGTLHAIDLALVGVAPTLWLEPRSSPAVVEYFAFFYFGYFWLCLAFVMLGMVARGRDGAARCAEFAIGTSFVYCIGQLGYMAVPAYGPVHHLATAYEAPLSGGFFWRSVLAAVEAGSAMKDVFPSLHTAAPTWFALYAARRATLTGSRTWFVVAAITTFMAPHIVVSTIVLRWHYLVDVAAGLALALLAAWLAPRLAALESRLRERAGWRPAWHFG